MKRTALLVVLLALVLFLVPTYAGKPAKEPPGIKVSDSQGNLLGALIRHEEDCASIGHYRVQIFVSSMGKFIDALGYELRHVENELAYEYPTDDCTGDAFIGQQARFRPDHLYYAAILDKTYTIMESQIRILVSSYYSLDTGVCRVNSDIGDGEDVYPLFEFAPEDVLIPLPLQFPLSYGY